MGEWIKEDGHPLHKFVCQTRDPQTILREMRTVTDPAEALKLCREFPAAMQDHEMCLYQP